MSYRKRMALDAEEMAAARPPLGFANGRPMLRVVADGRPDVIYTATGDGGWAARPAGEGGDR